MVIAGVALAGAFLFVVLYWWAEGALDTSDAILLAVTFCGLIFGLFAAREAWQFWLASLPLAAAAGYAIYSFKLGGITAFYKRSCEGYVRAIQHDPRNLGAREALADALYSMNQLDRAIDELQVAVDMGAGMESQYKLGKWSKARYFRDTANPVCRWCETENAQGDRKCKKCGSDLPYENAFTRWLTGGRSASARYYLIVVAGIATVVVSLVVLPLKFAFLPLLACVVALVGWSLIGSARS